jgi:O-acetyl-ADP-ribose deacetylase (regulator of RNase III)
MSHAYELFAKRDELKETIMASLRTIKGLYHITHIRNLPSILTHGILAHSHALSRGIDFERIYNEGIISNRKDIYTPNNQSLWDFANLYFQPRNPMLYWIINNHRIDDLAILLIDRAVLDRLDIYISDGNAAAFQSNIVLGAEGLRALFPQFQHDLDLEWWQEADGSKRRIMAECLVPTSVPSDLIRSIYVGRQDTVDRVKTILQQSQRSVPVNYEPGMFFQPDFRKRLTSHLFLAKGDLFFSKMQTLTVSVNCVGVMGAGLASTAKYRFPDVYVRYQDLCRQQRIRLGKPYIYKRESSLADTLADEPLNSGNNSGTWFLLFPTKGHWREKSDIDQIEKGLQWFVENSQKEGVESLAIPALGCGLGGLHWRQVGPMLCQYLNQLDIPVTIYLPTDREIPPEELNSQFLLEPKP